MKTFLVASWFFGKEATSGFAAIIAACSTSRGAFLSRGDVGDMNKVLFALGAYRGMRKFGQALVDSEKKM